MVLRNKARKIHWAKMFKVINGAGLKGIAEFELAKVFKRDPEDLYFRDALSQLHRQGRIKNVLGQRDGMPCRIVQAVVVHTSAPALEEAGDGE